MHKRNALLFIVLFAFSSTLAFSQAITARNFNERFVVPAVTQLAGAENTYSAVIGNGNYGTLEQLRDAGFIDPALASGLKYGYHFSIEISENSFQIDAVPAAYRRTGIRSFHADEQGIVYGRDLAGQRATVNDPEIDTCVFWGNSDNEKCTIRDVRSSHGAEMTYSATVGNGNFGTFPQLVNESLLPARLNGQESRGYRYNVTIVPFTSSTPGTFKISAVPVIYGVTGFRSFFIDTSGILRGADKHGEPADETDPPIEN